MAIEVDQYITSRFVLHRFYISTEKRGWMIVFTVDVDSEIRVVQTQLLPQEFANLNLGDEEEVVEWANKKAEELINAQSN